MQRDFKFSSFYAAFARELEKNCLDPVRTVSNGESFAKTYDVVVDGEHFQLEGYEQTQTRRVIKWTVYVFMFMYGFIVLYAIIWLLLGDSIKAYFNIK